MALIDVTAAWLARVDGYCTTPTPVGVRIGRTQSLPEKLLPVDPMESEWLGGLSYNQNHLRDAVRLMHAGAAGGLFRKSLIINPTVTATPYSLSTDTLPVHGRLFVLDSTTSTPPYTPNLRRFAVFVPAHYSRTSAAGHYAWIHFPPVWGKDLAASPRGRDVSARYLSSFWLDNHLARYLVGFRLLANFVAAHIDAVLVLPLSRYTVGNGLEPMRHVMSAVAILQDVFAAIERLEPRLGPSTGGPSRIERLGASCNSFGGEYGLRMVTAPRRLDRRLRSAPSPRSTPSLRIVAPPATP
jgi:hypothetical protein